MRLPPAIAERLLARLLGAERSTPYVIGDLREEYHAVAVQRGVWLANAWYVVQTLRLGMRVRWERAREVRHDRDDCTHDGGSSTPPLPPGDLMKTELRQALRFLRHRPAFSGAIVLTVAIAIAATTLVFAVVNGVLLAPLPYANPDRLVAVWEHSLTRDNDHNVVSPANFLTWRDELNSLDGLAALVEFSSTVLGEGEPERIGVVQASAAYFEIVGAWPVAGRLYTDGDEAEGAESVVVLSEGYWRRRFGGDSSVIGRALNIGGAPQTVVGVLPERFDFDVAASFGGVGSRDLWVPPRFGAEARQAGGRFFQVVARLAPGATPERAQHEASALAARLIEQYPQRQTGWDINVVPLRQDLVGDVRRTLLVAFGAVCFVLLIACANVANLLLTRASERHQEMAVRAALGAGRGRLIRQLLTESMLLSVFGAVAGVLLAVGGLRALVASAPDIPRLDGIGIDVAVMAFALCATMVTALLFGLLPALHIAGADAGGWLKGRGIAGRRGAQRVRAALVVTQMALSLVLLIGAGLLVRSLVNRLDVGVGFDVERLLTAAVQLPSDPYDSPERQALLFEQLVDRVAAVPGVEQASAIIFPPLAGLGTGTSVWPMDRPDPGPGQSPTGDIRWIHRDYPATIGIPILAGRGFMESDRAGAPLVVLVNESAAREFWPGGDAVGKRIAMPWGDTLRAEVVGVVSDLRHSGPDEEPRAMIYWDHRQFRPFPQMSLVVRTVGRPGDVVAPIRAAMRELDPNLPLYNVRSMDELFAQAVARPRFTAVTLGAFALLALILAAIGTYAVIAYATEQRAQEIGIRMALGASRGAVLRMVVGQGLVLIAIALLVGTAGALALSRLLQSLVFDVATTDPATFTVMAALLALAGIIACWLPARRASGIDPASAIRAE
jgi:putative ABC transport system permease protein